MLWIRLIICEPGGKVSPLATPTASRRASTAGHSVHGKPYDRVFPDTVTQSWRGHASGCLVQPHEFRGAGYKPLSSAAAHREDLTSRRCICKLPSFSFLDSSRAGERCKACTASFAMRCPVVAASPSVL